MNPIYNKKNENKENNFGIEINYKKIKLWEDYFFRFEKGEKKENYINLVNNKFKEYKAIIKQKQKIIEEMYKIIEAKNKNLITPEMKKEMGIKEEDKKDSIKNQKYETSFLVLNKSDFEEIKK